MEVLNFVIVRSNSPHNLLLGRTAMQKMGIVVSTIHRAIKFYTPRGISTVFLTYEPKKIEEREKKLRVASLEIVKGILSCVDAEERIVVNEKYLDQTIVIGKQLPANFKKKLQDLLRSNVNVFSWTYTDMTGIMRTIMVGEKPFNTAYSLNEYNHIKPIKQKKRGLAPEQNEAICKEVEKLTKANILREVKYQTWVSNPIIVKKDDGRWKLCVDFTYINKACPKDCYPLPETDQKVESFSAFGLKCFLDAYKGYHQIQMAKGDEEKTSFFTRKRVFCYRRMPFGLKNTRATYQRLINKVFSNEIGWNLKVHVDDMIIKVTSRKAC
ncbi:hypothetical protein Tco_1043385 [Tanacetum coccineum]|uniref:Reverse transcriptase domain-containing protein n=1 Tax=Tanacetum coccineum TaxID=301880 RepID=A0ABQ5GMI9_9ASTR